MCYVRSVFGSETIAAMVRVLFRAFLLSLACSPLHAQTTFTPPVFGKGPVPFALLRQSWIEDFEARRVFSAAGHYSPDADLLRADGNHVEGLAGIRHFYSSIFDHFDCSINLISKVTSESNELAYDSGSYKELLTDRATHQVLGYHGDYLTIYRHFGLQWLIVQQAFTQATEAPLPAASIPAR
jgi:ketosteroid isomerase-like protein